MSLRFLAFHQGSGFTDRVPMEVMTKLFGKLAKEHPGSTIKEAPGTVALWWDRANKPGTLTMVTPEGETTRDVKPGEVFWLKNQTTLRATLENGTPVTAKVLANGETKIEPPKQRRARRAP